MSKYLLTATVLLSGCAPLQQAPLVYTSKQVLGIDISAPTTESAGISLNVGYKNIDAAYVPVAVSKTEGGANDTVVKDIFATYGEGHTTTNSETTPIKKEAIIESINKISDKKDEKLLQIQKVELQSETYNKLIELRKTSGAKLDSQLDGKLNETIADLKQIETLPPLLKENLDKKKQLDPQELTQTVEKLKDDASALEAQKNNKIKELKNSNDIQKRDAMSVFGSFDSDAGGENTKGVSHKLGKIFSTGVAAQHLTQGLQKYAALEQCLDLVKNTKEDKQKTALITLCTNIEDNAAAQVLQRAP